MHTVTAYVAGLYLMLHAWRRTKAWHHQFITSARVYRGYLHAQGTYIISLYQAEDESGLKRLV